MKKIFSMLLVIVLCAFLTACENLSDFEKTFGSKYIGVRENDIYYFVDENGQNPFGVTYDSIREFRNGIAQVSINKEYRYINEKGEVISGDYPVSEISKGYYVAYDKVTEKNILLNKDFKQLLDKKFDRIVGICDGYVAVENEGKSEIYTIKGELIVSEEDVTIYLYNDGYYALKKDDEYKVYNIDGTEIVSGKRVVDITEDLIIIKSDNFNIKVYNKKGKELNDGFNITLYESEVEKFWASKSGVHYVLNKDLEVIAVGKGISSDLYNDSKSLTFVTTNDGKYMVFNSKAKQVLDRPYDQLYLLGNYLVAYDCETGSNPYIKGRSHMYIFDINGKKIFDTDDENYFYILPKFDGLTNDLYVLLKDGDYGYKYFLLNKKTKELKEIKLQGIEDVVGGLALIKVKNETSGEYTTQIVKISNGELIFEAKDIVGFETFNNKYISYWLSNRKVGLIDFKGNVILDAKYDSLIINHVNN